MNTEEIKIQKIVRDCPWNKNLKPWQRKVYDFRVWIAGDYRAYFTQATGKTTTWELYDVDNSPIKLRESSTLTIRCHGQQRFIETVKSSLALIPTVIQIEERKKNRAAASEKYAAEAKAEQEAEAKRQRLDAAQGELLAAAKYAVDAMKNMRQGTFRGATARLQKVIDQIEGK